MAETASLPRVLVLSQRELERGLSFGMWHEAEDVLLAHTDGELWAFPRPAEAPRIRARRWAGRQIRRRSPGALVPPDEGGALGPRRPVDLAVAVLTSIWDLPLVESVRDLRRSAGAVAVWLPEVWPSQLDDDRVWLEPFAVADHLFVGEPESAQLLSWKLRRPVHFLPLATDALLFSGGGPTGGPRPIDVLDIGRRDEALHRALLGWATAEDRFYRFDTLSAPEATDVAVHRWALAQDHRRSSVAICSYAKRGRPEIGDLRWVPGRVFDALASGALLAGFPPASVRQHELFGREVVHPLPEDDPAGAVRRLAELVDGAHDQERAANVRTALAGHDWAHRWLEVLRRCGVPPGPQLQARVDHLAEVARSRSEHPQG